MFEQGAKRSARSAPQGFQKAETTHFIGRLSAQGVRGACFFSSFASSLEHAQTLKRTVHYICFQLFSGEHIKTCCTMESTINQDAWRLLLEIVCEWSNESILLALINASCTHYSAYVLPG